MSNLTFPSLEPVKVGKVVFAGYVRIPAGVKHTRQYEVAAWYTKAETVEDRWYPVWLSRDHIRPTEGRLWARVEAVITSEYTPALWGGVPVGSQPQAENHRNVGSLTSFDIGIGPDTEYEFIPVVYLTYERGYFGAATGQLPYLLGKSAKTGEPLPSYFKASELAMKPGLGHWQFPSGLWLERMDVVEGYEWRYGSLVESKPEDAGPFPYRAQREKVGPKS